ncbi:UDP-N-acetylglucosamine--N-acetylmuramyl-(pentapeptide) pyrophosphoryl-undecaprenol N-acetylglucosamine transferase [Nesterenkonia flava]|uniref:UDP-N-acetylglucosamine--N-acetylmuramyl-(pentapeptide) pyrophosphoryl-undecaprenol N-acetylglucosamine transferase n=2 Tax=Nesterenkonia flava TaxID=469799 RepID=A0ABU1FWP6_9MICC|nr:UDP-N-acetylglucosamine--N-acetylmuramyl-(pentapeptide) pyrophosphoryl-undecaprenol N-acetylglucosamine transferase [Nesterenkonia flava]MDR5712541.1 UDP-N-acetylglucosamine--N-acetylmuramyl-(pentapeptide) pyrophosphoryl-undecaprenol N-acetylglucosamine transferase [Nesterenkonia flava]
MLAIAEAIRRLAPQARQSMIGTQSGLETRLVPAAGYDLETIEKVPFPRRPTRDLFAFPRRFRAAIDDAAAILQARRADVVVGVGGYVCPPVFLAAKRLSIPVVLHEANARPGMANKLGSRFAAFTGVAFEGTPLKNAEWVGMPMARTISQLDRRAEQAAAREALGLDPELTTLVVTGGSSGALNLNNAVASALEDILATGVQVLHLTGRDKAVTDRHGTPLTAERYHQREYLDGMHLAYAAADLIVARSGAATVSEVAAVGLPAVFVPLPVGNGEQELNARGLVDAGGALLVKDEHFTRAWIRRNIVPLLEDPRLLLTMEKQSAERGISDADERMARAALRAAGYEVQR